MVVDGIPTVMPSLTQVQFANRLARPPLYPAPWTGDTAKNAGGILYSLMQAFGSQFAFVETQLQYAQSAMRIATATDVALDAVANDFFGTIIGFPEIMKRNSGEPDSSFRQRIFASLMLDAVTRNAIINVVTLYTGATPRVIEPWDPTLTGTYDTGVTYYDYDTPQNPGRYGDTLPYQFFVESQLPPYQGSNLPIYGYDSGLTYDFQSSSGGYYLDPLPSWFSGATALDALLNRTKALGTTVWRRYQTQPLVSYPRAQTLAVTAGATQAVITLNPAAAGFLSVLALASWNTAVSWTQNSQTQVTLNFTNPVPTGGGFVDWIATPVTNAGYAFLPINTGASTISVGVPASLTGYTFVAMPSWETNVYIPSSTSTQENLVFSNQAPAGGVLSYVFFPPAQSGNQSVSMGAESVSISITLAKPTSAYQAFVNPSWNTQYEITAKTSSGFTIEFSTVPPSAGSINWAWFQQT